MLDLTETPEASKELHLKQSKDSINRTLASLYYQISAGLKVIETTILENPNGLTKEEVRQYYGEDILIVDTLGEKAVEMLSMVKA